MTRLPRNFGMSPSAFILGIFIWQSHHCPERNFCFKNNKPKTDVWDAHILTVDYFCFLVVGKPWKTSSHLSSDEVSVSMFHYKDVSPYSFSNVFLYRSHSLFIPLLWWLSLFSFFSLIPEWLVGKAVFICTLQSYESHAVHRVRSPGPSQHVGPLDYHAEHDRWGHLLCHVCRPCHSFNPVFGFLQAAVSREGNLFYR